jgi:hypothetical protein
MLGNDGAIHLQVAADQESRTVASASQAQDDCPAPGAEDRCSNRGRRQQIGSHVR